MVNGTDVTVTSGTSVVFASSLTSGDVVDITTFGVFNITGMNASNLSSGTVPEARLPTTTFMTNVLNDLSTIALRQATNENAIAYNTNSSFVDVFQDASGIASNTTAPHNSAEYVSSVSSGGTLPTGTSFYLRGDQANGSTSFTDLSTNSLSITAESTAHSNNRGKIGSTSMYFNGSTSQLYMGNNSAFHFGTDQMKIEMWVNFPNFSNDNKVLIAQGGWGTQADYAGWTFYINSTDQLKLLSSSNNTGTHGSWSINMESTALSWSNNTWYHVAVARNSNGILKIFRDGTQVSYASTTGQNNSTDFAEGNRDFTIGSASDATDASRETMYLDHILVTKGSGSGRSANFTPETDHYGDTINATGNFISNTITAPSSTSKMGAIITYQDNAGTNTLNTDIILQLSADNGSNFTTATLTALPNYSTGIKMAKVNDLSVTAGTQLKYKISFANQSSGSKEARIRGVSLQY
jgi:predicted RecA/RadA family phage recombinase